MNFLRKKKGLPAARHGFTLVEILIVIMIIGMLSVLAVNGYMGYRRSTLLDFAVDSLVSQMYEARANTIHGDFGSERADEIRQAIEDDAMVDPPVAGEAKCYGLYFEKNADEFDVFSFSEDFDSEKEWVGISGWQYKGCGIFGQTDLMPLELDEMVSVGDIISNSGMSVNLLVMRFIPPNGDLKLSFDRNSFVAPASTPDILQIQLNYGTDERSLKIDLASLTVSHD